MSESEGGREKVREANIYNRARRSECGTSQTKIENNMVIYFGRIGITL